MMRKLLCLAMLFAALNLFALPALGKEEESAVPNARFLGYEKEYKVEESNVTLVYFTWILFVAVGMSVLFIKSKRTHLD